MQRRRRSLSTLVLMLAVGILSAGGGGLAGAAGSGMEARPFDMGTGGPGFLEAVSGTSPDDVWAVGADNDAGTLIEHWDGSAWSVVPSPSPGAAASLADVTAISPDDAWAVGTTRASATRPPKTLLLHWDGTSWSRATSEYQDTPFGNTLDAVTAVASDDVWAVGSFHVDHPRSLVSPLVEHWDGTSWKQVAIKRHPHSASNPLRDIDATSSSDVWTVGWYGSQGDHPLFNHWGGSSWQPLDGPATDGVLSADAVAAITPTDTWAVVNGQHARPWHWDGAEWTIGGDACAKAVVCVLQGMDALATDDVWSVGFIGQGQLTHPFWRHWDGARWSVVHGPKVWRKTEVSLSDVAMLASDDVWAVGYAFDPSAGTGKTVVLHWDGTTWSVS